MVITFSSIASKVIILLQWLGLLSTDATDQMPSGSEWSTYTAESNEPIDEEPIDLTLPRISGSGFSTFPNGNESMDESSMADGPLKSTFIEQSKHIVRFQQ